MVKMIDRTGHVYGRWTLLERIPAKRAYICKCQCGTVKAVQMTHLRAGRTKSCGCLERELASARAKTHGMSQSIEYRTWLRMRDRCSNPNAPHYECYGGRGIAVCERWANSFEDFYEDMGPRPSRGHSIDRIDVNGNYEPSNCRWATVEQQRRNTRANRFVQYLGKNVCIAEAAELSGIQSSTLLRRLKLGWKNDRLFSPVRPMRRARHPLSVAA
jgi:hypothetical protein